MTRQAISQPLAFVDSFNKGSNGALACFKLRAACVDLLLLQGFYDAFRLGIVARIADSSAHAGLDVMHRQGFRGPGPSHSEIAKE